MLSFTLATTASDSFSASSLRSKQSLTRRRPKKVLRWTEAAFRAAAWNIFTPLMSRISVQDSRLGRRRSDLACTGFTWISHSNPRIHKYQKKTV
eukprot:scaffold123363_cov38-Tisochrysis_lutea.AAC.1